MIEQAQSDESLNEIFDLLIVGGGPAGTTAAFRATELGLKALVIDYDDLMKRIRDYPKNKSILPGFGGGDKMKFPLGGELLSTLYFSPIDKDDMCIQWKALYQQHGVKSRIGVELRDLEEADAGIYRVRTYDHVNRKNLFILAKHIVVAIGRGVPRRFDIPGNMDGIAFRLSDPEYYVGRPACVIGGGTSAAEAVIAISNAKVAAKDTTAVCWFYRGDRMPRVSKALSDVFFEAYLINGNIRYYPKSDPAAIVTGEDRKESLSIRVDRRVIEGRPTETTHLEFLKESCIACIGEDIPESLLNTIGIRMLVGGPKNKKRMVVTRCLETQRKNVYLIGDLLSQAYFETDDFNADPSQFKEIKHAGNIKTGMRDGVLVAQVVKQKIEGVQEIDTGVLDAETLSDESRKNLFDPPKEPELPKENEMSASPQAPKEDAFLIRMLPSGVAEGEYPLKINGATTIGRQGCDIDFPQDNTISDKAASISHNREGYLLSDEGTPSGIFFQIPEAKKVDLAHGDLLHLGRQFLQISTDQNKFIAIHYNHLGSEIGSYDLGNKAIVFGRCAPEIPLDSQDMTLSRRHIALSVEGGTVAVKDLKSINGSYLRVRNPFRMTHGDQFRVGQQHFIFSLQSGVVIDPGHTDTRPAPVRPPTTPPQASAPAPVSPQIHSEHIEENLPPASSSSDETSLFVTFKDLGKKILLKEGQNICEAAEENGLDITAECHAGICGSDPLRVLKGSHNFSNALSDQETETLEDICDLKPGEYRLACMSTIKGPVEVEIVKS